MLTAFSAFDRYNDETLVNRNDAQKADAVKRFGGSRETERAVADGLAWLAAHQRSDGVWDRRGFDQMCPEDDRCSQTALAQLDRDADVGVSALAAMAFLGAGFTHESGPYAEHLSRVFSYLLAQQTVSGSFAPDSSYQSYNDAVAAIAIAEAFVLTRDPILKDPLTRVVGHLARCQQAGGGWDLTADTSTNRNDTTVSAWVLMALKSAEAAGVSAPIETRLRLLAQFDRATLSDGRVWHSDKTEKTSRRPAISIGVSDRRYGPGITATGLYARAALGLRLDEPMAQRQVTQLLSELPDLDELNRRESTAWHNEYYWYYGTMAMFNVGGEPWQEWNAALRRTVLEHQERPVSRKGKRGHRYGSWPAFGKGWGQWGRSGGRIYSTAINTLTLEIYYRYVPSYLSPRGLLGPIEVRTYLKSLRPSEHGTVLSLARRLHPDAGEPMLLELLGSPDSDVRTGAAISLAELGSPMGLAELRAATQRSIGEESAKLDAAIARVAMPRHETTFGRVTEINSQARMLLFETGGSSIYYGQPLRVIRGDDVVGAIRVNRRFTPQRAGAARIESESSPIQVGDIVMTVESE